MFKNNPAFFRTIKKAAKLVSMNLAKWVVILIS